MPDLFQSLQGRDLGYLRIVADLWGLEFSAPDARVGLLRLVPLILNPSAVAETVSLLPQDARLALNDLLAHDGRLPWSLFTRRYGTLRDMGPGRRDRERPWINAASSAEALWYRALIGRAFFDTQTGPEEFAFVPEDLLALLPAQEPAMQVPLGRLASPGEKIHPYPANDRILDHACTLLSALRLGFSSAQLDRLWDRQTGLNGPLLLSPAVLQELLRAAGLLGPDGMPLPEPVRAFLEAPRADALLQLFQAWLHSTAFNELQQVPGLVLEGEWHNDPFHTRHTLLDYLSAAPGLDLGKQRPVDTILPDRPYSSLSGFIAAVRQTHPDFQRPAGDYDSWFIRDQTSGKYLRGFESWDRVDGALIRYLVCGPLHWLGLVDLASPSPNEETTAFRYSSWASHLLRGLPPEGLDKEDENLFVTSDARVRAPIRSPRAARYQVARFSEWEGETDTGYHYRLVPAALERARQQGLRVSHLLALLRRNTTGVPPVLARALERWESNGSEARFEKAVVLRLSNPDLLQSLRSSRAARFLGDPLGPTAVIVKPGAVKKVMAVLAEMGILSEVLGVDEES